MYTQTNRFRRDDMFLDENGKGNENMRTSTPVMGGTGTTQKVWSHGYRKHPRRIDKPVRRFTARRQHHGNDNNNTNNITSLHDITLKIRKLYDDFANSSSPSPPFKPINYKRIHKRWKNKKFKQQVGGVGTTDCLATTRPKSVTIKENPDGSETFIVEPNSTDHNVSGSLDEVMKTLMKKPNPPGTISPSKFPLIVPPDEPKPDEADLPVDGSLAIITYNTVTFKKMYGASTPIAPITPITPIIPIIPTPIEADPKLVKQHDLIMAAAAIAVIGAAGAIAAAGDGGVAEAAAAAAAADAAAVLEAQKKAGLAVAAASIAGLAAFGATEDPTGRIDEILRHSNELLATARGLQESSEIKRCYANYVGGHYSIDLQKRIDAATRDLTNAGIEDSTVINSIEILIKRAQTSKGECADRGDTIQKDYEEIGGKIRGINQDIRDIEAAQDSGDLKAAILKKNELDAKAQNVTDKHRLIIDSCAFCDSKYIEVGGYLEQVHQLIGDRLKLEGREKDAEALRKKAAEEEARRKHELSLAAAAIAAIGAAGAIEGPAPPPAPEPAPEEVIQPPKDEDLPWAALYTKWTQVFRMPEYVIESKKDILWDEDEENDDGEIDNFKEFDPPTTRAAFENILKTANSGKNIDGIASAYRTRIVYSKINKWVTKWKELGGSIRTFISFKTGLGEEAQNGDPYKVTNADLLIEKVIAKTIPSIVNPDTITPLFTNFIAWVNIAGNMEKLIAKFKKYDISPFATNDETKANLDIVKGYGLAVPTGSADEIAITTAENERKMRNQRVIICKLILLKVLNDEELKFYNKGDFFDTQTTAIKGNEQNAKIIEILKDISDVQFNQMFVYYDPTFKAKGKTTKPILPKLLSDAFPYTINSAALGAGGSAIVKDLKNVLYGKFYSVWDSSVLGNQARYDNGKFDSLIKILKNGGNVALFGYGYSGSGKTYTLTNEDDVQHEWGIGPKLIENLLRGVGGGITYSASVEELYCNSISYTLLTGYGYPMTLDKLKTQNQLAKNTIPYGETVANANDVRELIEMMQAVKKKRIREGRIKATVNNSESSRGHLFYTIKFTAGNKMFGKMVICDMGGRENPIEMAEQTYMIISNKGGGNAAYIGCIAKKVTGKDNTYSLWPPNGRVGNRRTYSSKSIDIRDNKYTIVGITSDTGTGSSSNILPFTIKSAFGLFNDPGVERLYNDHKKSISPSIRADIAANSAVIMQTLDDFFIACREGFFINETINHLTAYINYLSMMGATLIDNKIMYTSISEKPANIDKKEDYDPINFIQDPMRVIRHLEQKLKGSSGNLIDLGEQSIISISRKAREEKTPGKAARPIEPQEDFFGIITKLWGLKYPCEAKSSVICVMACIRTSHKYNSDIYRIATEKTLNFAISVSASNPSMKGAVQPIAFTPIEGRADSEPAEGKPIVIIGPVGHTARDVANYVATLLMKNKQHTKNFKQHKDPVTNTERLRLLAEYLGSSDYTDWKSDIIKRYPSAVINMKDRDIVKAFSDELIRLNFHGGTTRRMCKSNYSGHKHKRTRRLRYK